MATILHISDLHRDSGSQLTNESLLESLRLDRERYQSKQSQPDIAVVSGDIVYGVNSDDAKSDEVLRQQYSEAEQFLSRLADLFFNGDRERIILTPGNHDISHPHVLRASAQEPIPSDAENKAILLKQFAGIDSPWRWVWTDFSLRRIKDFDSYKNRLEPYSNFYCSFYQGRRKFSLNPPHQFNVHDFPHLGIIVVSLSSCHENDLFNRYGRIHPDCVAGATRAVAEATKNGSVAIATWHHNLSGGPRDVDYVDADFLQSLIDGGFSVGLHGHQHRPQILEHRFSADRRKSIAVISAGTLCGGPRTLPPGRRRAYNLITINLEKRLGSLAVREMRNEGFGSPVWGEAYMADFSGTSIDFDLGPKKMKSSNLNIADEAARLIRTGNWDAVYLMIQPNINDPWIRRVIVEELMNVKHWHAIKSFCTPPKSNIEIIAALEALYELGEKEQLRSVILSEEIANNQDTSVRQAIGTAQNRLR